MKKEEVTQVNLRLAAENTRMREALQNIANITREASKMATGGDRLRYIFYQAQCGIDPYYTVEHRARSLSEVHSDIAIFGPPRKVFVCPQCGRVRRIWYAADDMPVLLADPACIECGITMEAQDGS